MLAELVGGAPGDELLFVVGKDFDIDVALPPGVSAVALGDIVKIEIDLQLLEPDTAT